MDEKSWNEELERAIKENYAAGPSAQADAVEAFLADPSPETTDKVWIFLIVGLLVLLAIALLGIIALVIADKDTQVLLTAFTAALTGLLGLFIQSPAKGG